MTKEQILYEDDDIIVCHKPAGIATQTAKVGQRDMVSEVTNYLAAHDQGKPYVGIINRLDQPVEGILVFGKNQKAANALSRQIVSGKGLSVNVEPEGIRRETLTDHMLKDNRSNMSRIVSPEVKGAKKAVLKYEVLERKESIALVRIKLITGRHHQIRVQMSHAGMAGRWNSGLSRRI